MVTSLPALWPHPEGEQPLVEEFSATAETFAGRVHVEWDSGGHVTPLGQLPFFIVRRTEEPVGLGGFTTHDLKRCRLLAGSVALIFNWWSLFVRLADLDHRPEAITSRPLLMQAIARQTQHAGQVTLTITSTHGEQPKARRAYRRIACFLAKLRQTAEQLDPVQRWYRILSEALKRYLSGRQLDPPPRLAPA